jgi:hypothetical protein
MMVRKRDIDIEVIMTTHGACDISCEVYEDEARFIFGRIVDGLRLDMDLSALEKFVAVAEKVMDQIRQMPRGEWTDFVVYADDHSRKAHVPEPKQHDGVQVVK